MSAFLQFLAAVPKLFDLYRQIGTALEKIDLDKDIKEIQEVHDALGNATNLKQKLEAARKLSTIIKRL